MSNVYNSHNEEWRQLELCFDVDPKRKKDDGIKIELEDPWKDRGECPRCNNGIKPKCFRGVFTCEKCGWQNGNS